MRLGEPVEPAEANEEKDCGNHKSKQPAHLDKRSRQCDFDNQIYDLFPFDRIYLAFLVET